MTAFRSVLKEGVLGEGLVKGLVLTAYLTTSTCLVLRTFRNGIESVKNSGVKMSIDQRRANNILGPQPRAAETRPTWLNKAN
jgi:hypothetical protein